LIFHLVEMSECWLSASGGPNLAYPVETDTH
jgi:hypothetical protein